MNRRIISLAVLGLAVSAGLVFSALTLRSGDDEIVSAAPDPAPGGVFFSYAAKFVCGYQAPLATSNLEPPVKPGNYATEINIHNPNYVGSAAGVNGLQVWKKLVFLVGTRGNVPFAFREPQIAKPSKFVTFLMPPDTATMDDCQAIWRMSDLVGSPVTPGAFTIGYLVVISARELDIDAVYTAAVPGTPGTPATGIAEDVERVTPKRIKIPDNVLP